MIEFVKFFKNSLFYMYYFKLLTLMIDLFIEN